jgi:hypothetical protein
MGCERPSGRVEDDSSDKDNLMLISFSLSLSFSHYICTHIVLPTSEKGDRLPFSRQICFPISPFREFEGSFPGLVYPGKK